MKYVFSLVCLYLVITLTSVVALIAACVGETGFYTLVMDNVKFLINNIVIAIIVGFILSFLINKKVI